MTDIEHDAELFAVQAERTTIGPCYSEAEFHHKITMLAVRLALESREREVEEERKKWAQAERDLGVEIALTIRLQKEIEELREENRLVTEQNTQMNEALLKGEREIERLDWELDAVQSDPSARNDVLEEAATMADGYVEDDKWDTPTAIGALIRSRKSPVKP